MIAELKAQVDDIIAAECALCGDFMIRSVDKPFVESSDEEARWVI